jgi:hypothetical protein
VLELPVHTLPSSEYASIVLERFADDG